jgi:hypothetical protein
MPPGGRHACAKCGSTDHTTSKCTSTIELRNLCICSEVEGLEPCGNFITKQNWDQGYRIHRKCKHFLAGVASLIALIGTYIPGGGKKKIKPPGKVVSGTGETRDRLRAEAEARGESRRSAKGAGNSGPARKMAGERYLKEKMDATHFEAITAASSKPGPDGRIPVAKVIAKLINDASPLRTRLVFRRADAAGRSARERSGDPTVGRSDVPTPATVFAVDCLLWLLKCSKDGRTIEILDVENKLEGGAAWKDLVERHGLGGAYAKICWETCISKGPCSPGAEISRTAYAVADMSNLTLERRWDADKQQEYHVCFGTASVSQADHKAVLAQRDQRVPLGYQNGPEREMARFLCIGILLWDIYAALSRAAGHENNGKPNELLYLPMNAEALAFYFGLKFKHRAEPDTIDEIKFCQALGFEFYQVLKEDPECPIDEIIEKRFPGKDPAKWDFSSFKRSAPAVRLPRKRKARDEVGEEWTQK